MGSIKYITPDKIDEALNIIETETVGLRVIGERLGIDKGDLCRALNNTEEIAQRYARAKEKQIEIKIDEMDDAITSLINDVIDDEIDAKTKSALVQAVKLKVDNDKWIAAKLKPKKYGDRLEVSGQVQHTHAIRPPDLSTLPPADLKALLAIQARVAGALPPPDQEPDQGSTALDKAQEVKPLSVSEISTRNDNGEIWLI